jgi:hypothetical protein
MTHLKKDKTCLFYQLTNQEWIETVKDLTGAEIKVLYYVRTLDPFGDRELDYSVTQMALQLGLSKGAVSKALKKLDQIDLIDVELVRVKIHILTNKNSKTELPIRNSISYRKHELPIVHENFPEETDVSSGKHKLPIENEQQPEALPDNNYSLTHTNKTYSDFKKTLSESERENFLEFGHKKAAQLPKKPELPLKWIEKNFEELRAEWEKSQGRTNAQIAEKWENHPHRVEWLEKIRLLGPVGFQAEDMPNQKLRRSFYLWAEENKLIWGEMES